MIELRERPDGALARGYGGDTLNTAVYLARLGIGVDYVTALGDDPWSAEMVEGWRREGVGTGHVHRLPGRLPGLYIIQTDPAGERRFSYWRDSAAARQMLDHADLAALGGYDLVYVSGITLSIFDPPGRETLLAMLGAVRRRGGRVAFDTNFRPRGWPDRAVARDLYRQVFGLVDIVFASVEDLTLLFGAPGETELRGSERGREIVLKLEQPACRVIWKGGDVPVAAAPVTSVVDTTAAGDSFAAGYLAARLGGADPPRAARAGHDLAGVVVGHPGAIVPRAAMAHLMCGDAERDTGTSPPS